MMGVPSDKVIMTEENSIGEKKATKRGGLWLETSEEGCWSIDDILFHSSCHS